ncbi:MAG: DUF4159 domain-containing protein [Phormidesmis sp. CAN_BIN36]|nr:DUF4159 domain-containing protein [Phormidesmis sp. CAN_BIN36]
MSSPPHLFPSPNPLKRLHVYDGLMMNSRRWQMADHYHRQRQNLQFQSLHQPGIVCGLGVRMIAPPDHLDQDSKTQFPHWLEIEPGIAIDATGNPIIVDPDTDRTYPIVARPSGRRLTLYIVISYAEPQSIPQSNEETLREWFRVDQVTETPNAHQVELCRIELIDPVQLALPSDWFAPGVNQLDFRHRRSTQPRSQGVVRAGQIKPGHDSDAASDLATYTIHQQNRANLSELMQSAFSLYPALRGDAEVAIVNLGENLANYDFLYWPDAARPEQLTRNEWTALSNYLQAGGGLLIETSAIDHNSQFNQIQQLLQQNLTAETISLVAWEQLPRQHLLRRSPFLFGALPTVHHPIQVYNSGGIILIEGRLSPVWGLTETLQLKRSEIREAQEFGINLLHFFWQRRQANRLTQWDEASPTGNKQQRGT